MSFPYAGPIPPYTNPPVNPQYYQPRYYNIAALTLGVTTTVQTTTAHDYVVGQQIRLQIPQANGSYQLNNRQGTVIEILSSTEVVVTIDSKFNVDPFTTTSSGTQPVILAIGDYNSGQQNAIGPSSVTTYIDGSFINISPE